MNEDAGRVMAVAPTTEIWSVQRRVTRRLLAWALGSMALGWLLARSRSALARAFGVQACVWGAVDAAIAFFGQRSAERTQMRATPAVETAQARRLRRLLWVNAGLDVGYVAGGAWLAATARTGRRSRPARLGHGLGIVAQGAFLLVFDVVHARRVAKILSD